MEPLRIKLLTSGSCPYNNMLNLMDSIGNRRNPVEIFLSNEKHLGIGCVYYVLKEIHFVCRIYWNHDPAHLEDSEPCKNVVRGVWHRDRNLFPLFNPKVNESIGNSIGKEVYLREAVWRIISKLQKRFVAQFFSSLPQDMGQHPLCSILFLIPLNVKRTTPFEIYRVFQVFGPFGSHWLFPFIEMKY